MDNIRIFQNEQFGQVRIAVNENGEPVFCLADVCNMLDLIPSKVAQRLSDDVLSKYPIVDNLGREQIATFIHEDRCVSETGCNFCFVFLIPGSKFYHFGAIVFIFI